MVKDGLRTRRRAGLLGPGTVTLVVLVAAWYVITSVLAASTEGRSARAAAELRSELTRVAVIHEETALGLAGSADRLVASQQVLDGLLDDGLSSVPEAEAKPLRLDLIQFAFAPPSSTEAASALHRSLDDRVAAVSAAASQRADEAADDLLRATIVTAVVALLILLPAVYIQGWSGSRRGDAHARVEMEHRHRALVEHSPIQTYVVADNGSIEFASPAAMATLGARVRTMDELLSHLSPNDETLGAAWRAGSLGFGVPHVVQAEDTWYEVITADHRDDPAVSGIIITAQDVTPRVELEQLLRRQAASDELTGLANRRSFDAALAKACSVASRRRSLLGLLLIDLDGFKAVNDTLGHQVGDELLMEVGDRLVDCTRSNEHLARFGGDEFALVVENVVGREELEEAADRLIDAIRVPVQIRDDLIAVEASIGIAFGAGSISPERLVRRADEALYEAKRGGRGQWRLHGEELREDENST